MENHLNKINALRQAARNLSTSNAYQWGHMGLCNCGFLAQEITALSKEEIHRRAMLRHGDWREQLNDYCPTSGLPMDDLITTLLNTGFTQNELVHLERLSDPEVLGFLPEGDRKLMHNKKSDVVLYMQTWANHLEEKLIRSIRVPDLSRDPSESTAFHYSNQSE